MQESEKYPVLNHRNLFSISLKGRRKQKSISKIPEQQN